MRQTLDSEETIIAAVNNEFIVSRRVYVIFFSLILLGIAGVVIGISTGDAGGVWRSLLVNALFFTGLSYGGAAFSALLTLTNAKWGKPFKHLAGATIFFIPVNWIVLSLLFLGMGSFFDWVDPGQPIVGKEWWLNATFFVFRNLFLQLLTGILGILYVLASWSSDLASIEKDFPDLKYKPATPFLKRKERLMAFFEAIGKYHVHLASIYAILYVVATSVIAIDWIMSIGQEWINSLFPAQYAFTGIFGAGAALILISSIIRSKFDLESTFTPERHQDLSRLVFAFTIFYTYLVFSQILVIWYANLPEESSFIFIRMNSDEWSDLFFFLFIILCVIPFFGLLNKRACRSPFFSSIIAGIVLFGLWCEKYLLVAPSIWKNNTELANQSGYGFQLIDFFITVGMTSLIIFLALACFRIFPLLKILRRMAPPPKEPIPKS